MNMMMLYFQQMLFLHVRQGGRNAWPGRDESFQGHRSN